MLTRLYKKILLCIFLLAPLPLTAAPFTKLVVFGDSLSDNGNLAFFATIPPFGLGEFNFLNSPPYNHGFNNGAPAVEQLANILKLPLIPSRYLLAGGIGTNFAVAGAKASGDREIDLNTQIATFLVSQAGNAPNDALYILFIGGNDIRDMRDQTDEKETRATLDKATRNIYGALTQLLDAGATHFLVVNSPDIGKIPETRALATSNPELIKRASQKTLAYNKRLADTVNFIKKRKGSNIVLFDVYTFFNGIVGNGKAYHFRNTKEACFSSFFHVYNPICDATKMDSFTYFDEIHPTQRVHERVGRALFAVVPEAN
jgi:outer membrane lipase/esterase